MPAPKISVDIEARLGKLESGYRVAEQKTRETASRMQDTMVADGPFGNKFISSAAEQKTRETASRMQDTMVADGPFGNKFISSAAKAFVGLKAIETGFRGISAVSALLRGDVEKTWEQLGRIPILGQLVTAFREMKNELTGSAEQTRIRVELEEREKTLIEQIASSRRANAQIEAKASGGPAAAERLKIENDFQDQTKENRKRISDLLKQRAEQRPDVTDRDVLKTFLGIAGDPQEPKAVKEIDKAIGKEMEAIKDAAKTKKMLLDQMDNDRIASHERTIDKMKAASQRAAKELELIEADRVAREGQIQAEYDERRARKEQEQVKRLEDIRERTEQIKKELRDEEEERERKDRERDEVATTNFARGVGASEVVSERLASGTSIMPKNPQIDTTNRNLDRIKTALDKLIENTRPNQFQEPVFA